MPKVCHLNFRGHGKVSSETAYLVDSRAEPLEATAGFEPGSLVRFARAPIRMSIEHPIVCQALDGAVSNV